MGTIRHTGSFFPERKDLGGFSLDGELYNSPYMVIGFIVACLGFGWGERQGSEHMVG
jgi:hypothetical protein